MNYHIRVHYPFGTRRPVLRTDADWDADRLPVHATATEADFSFTSDDPHIYFKPCLRAASGELVWSTGGNYLALGDAPAREVYPHFFGGAVGRLTELLPLPSGGARAMRIYLPPGYDENTLKRYPVIYMHDGANLFLPEETFSGVAWDVDETLDLLNEMSLVDKVIVVGLHVDGVTRKDTYTAPGYEAYAAHLFREVIPRVERDFRTLGGPENTAVMGSSLGGVVSFFLAWQHPSTFGKVACLSSTFDLAPELARRVETEPKRPIRIYADSGWPRDNYEGNRSMVRRLLDHGYTFGSEVLYFAFPNERHTERAWATRCHLPFQYLFGECAAGLARR